MNLKVSVEQREVSFNDGGKGLDNLINYIGNNKDKISKITFIGDTSSYTFTRQIHLLINLLNRISDFEISYNGKILDKGELIFPVYE